MIKFVLILLLLTIGLTDDSAPPTTNPEPETAFFYTSSFSYSQIDNLELEGL